MAILKQKEAGDAKEVKDVANDGEKSEEPPPEKKEEDGKDKDKKDE